MSIDRKRRFANGAGLTGNGVYIMDAELSNAIRSAKRTDLLLEGFLSIANANGATFYLPPYGVMICSSGSTPDAEATLQTYSLKVSNDLLGTPFYSNFAIYLNIGCFSSQPARDNQGGGLRIIFGDDYGAGDYFGIDIRGDHLHIINARNGQPEEMYTNRRINDVLNLKILYANEVVDFYDSENNLIYQKKAAINKESAAGFKMNALIKTGPTGTTNNQFNFNGWVYGD